MRHLCIETKAMGNRGLRWENRDQKRAPIEEEIFNMYDIHVCAFFLRLERGTKLTEKSFSK